MKSVFVRAAFPSMPAKAILVGAWRGSSAAQNALCRGCRSRLLRCVPQIQVASFALFACLGSVQRTARGHPNASTAKNNVKDIGKLAKGKVRSKTRPIPTMTDSPTTKIHIGSASVGAPECLYAPFSARCHKNPLLHVGHDNTSVCL